MRSTRAVDQAIAQVPSPPRVAADEHRHDLRRPARRPNDEATGAIGGEEPHVPLYWECGVRIARRWEPAQQEPDLMRALRSAPAGRHTS